MPTTINPDGTITVTLQYFRVTREVTETRHLVVCAESEEEARALAWEADPALWAPVKHSDHWEAPQVEPHLP